MKRIMLFMMLMLGTVSAVMPKGPMFRQRTMTQ